MPDIDEKYKVPGKMNEADSVLQRMRSRKSGMSGRVCIEEKIVQQEVSRYE